MKKLSIIVVISVWLAYAGSVAAQEQTRLRTWNVTESGQELEAELVAWDPESGEVTLRDELGRHIELLASELHISDRRYLDRQHARQNRGKRRQGSSSDRIDRALARNRGGNPGQGVQHLYGIDWHKNPNSAARAAAGNERTSDDKPIIWFRVLGDLDGFM